MVCYPVVVSYFLFCGPHPSFFGENEFLWNNSLVEEVSLRSLVADTKHWNSVKLKTAQHRRIAICIERKCFSLKTQKFFFFMFRCEWKSAVCLPTLVWVYPSLILLDLKLVANCSSSRSFPSSASVSSACVGDACSPGNSQLRSRSNTVSALVSSASRPVEVGR